MKTIKLKFDEVVSLRTFLIATVFKFYDLCEMETVTGYEGHHVLDIVTKLDKKLDVQVKTINYDFSLEETSVIANCIMFGYLGVGIYRKYKELIDYKSCEFPLLAKRLIDISNED